MGVLGDGFGRRFTYVRLSVTEACNFRCGYCLPAGYRKTAPHDFLSPAEVGRLARALVGAGIGKIRLTGGEPSVRGDITRLIAAVAAAGAHKVALTTNGWNLERRLDEWTEAGLTHLNVSVDSLDASVFARVTGRDVLPAVLRGIDRALALGRLAVKLNAVLLRDTVGVGLEAMAAYLRDRPLSVRFIELMRTADNADYFADQHVAGAYLRSWLAARGWRPLARDPDAGPATEYAHPGHLGRFGLIAPYGAGFCGSCNRLRVTARGRLRLCLFGAGEVDLRDLLGDDGNEAVVIARIQESLAGKAVGHGLRRLDFGHLANLSAVGG